MRPENMTDEELITEVTVMGKGDEWAKELARRLSVRKDAAKEVLSELYRCKDCGRQVLDWGVEEALR